MLGAVKVMICFKEISSSYFSLLAGNAWLSITQIKLSFDKEPNKLVDLTTCGVK